ncbi:8383_t:CDS:2 [Paraglomus occultum]|uniref:8383_t:CDS:1 n=1 Tax=Paraglomus occultum TaxID=144539 RepID=A0A9N9D422_9GLOM|nr:8383_t:CDS:2 [Paraglomus occultum]
MSVTYNSVTPEAFNKILVNYIEKRSKKRQAKAFITQEMYDQAILILLNPNNIRLADKKYRHWVRTTFELRESEDGHGHVLYKKSKGRNARPARPVCPKERLFEVLTDIHDKLQHPGMTVFWNAIASKYAYITQDLVENFISYCSVCNAHRRMDRFSTRPIIKTKFLTRVQVDILQMSHKDEDFQYVCLAKDYYTQWLWTAPLKIKNSQEVARALHNMFIVFGAPLILQSSNGKSFTVNVIQKLMKMWPQSKIIHGKSCLQSPEIVEKANDIFKKSLVEWMESNKTLKWSNGLSTVTYTINTSVSRVTNTTPYELVFSQKVCTDLNLVKQLQDTDVHEEHELDMDFAAPSYYGVSNFLCNTTEETTFKQEHSEPTIKQEEETDEGFASQTTTQTYKIQRLNTNNYRDSNNVMTDDQQNNQQTTPAQALEPTKPMSIKDFWEKAKNMTEENWENVKELLSSSEDILATEKSTDKLKNI